MWLARNNGTATFKANIGVNVRIGKAGNPDVMDNVNPALVIGSNTDIIAAEGTIVTAGGIDTHVHFICPQQVEESISSGITSMFGGGTGPSTASVAANCTPSKTYIRQMMQALDTLPVNFGVIGKGSDTGKLGLYNQCNAGVAGLKLHEDWGCTPSAIDSLSAKNTTFSVSKYTINPAPAQGISHVMGSVEVGKFADLVIWEPASFGTKPFQVLKGGFIASAQMGDQNASISTVQPMIARSMFAPLLPSSSVMFVSKAGMENGSVKSYGLTNRNCEEYSHGHQA